MKLGRLIQFALVAAAVLIMAASASATTIQWTTNGVATGFTSAPAGYTITDGGLELLDAAAGVELLFTPNASPVGGNAVPSNVDFGDFLLICTGCATGGTAFGSFTFSLEITDVTDSATGVFTGTSTAGTVTPTSATMDVNWSPTQVGPGTTNATGGTNFSTTFFTVPNMTLIVAPNSGTPPGDTSIQGTVSSTLVPEPATMAMVGGLFVGLAALARKRRRS
jgi:hypothetical protein